MSFKISLQLVGENFDIQFPDLSSQIQSDIECFLSGFVRDTADHSTQDSRKLTIEFTSHLSPKMLEPQFSFEGQLLTIQHHFFNTQLDLERNVGNARIMYHANGKTALQRLIGLDSCLRILLSMLLRSSSGFLIHASGFVNREGQAIVAPGPSGSGKTTLLGKCPLENIIGDETIGIIKNGHGWQAWSTPFLGSWQKKVINRHAPLTAIFFLEQLNRFHLSRCPIKEAFRKMIQRVLYFQHDLSSVNSLTEQLLKYASEIPSWRFSYLEKEPWDKIYAYMDDALSSIQTIENHI